jgi:hypothetical protein
MRKYFVVQQVSKKVYEQNLNKTNTASYLDVVSQETVKIDSKTLVIGYRGNDDSMVEFDPDFKTYD